LGGNIQIEPHCAKGRDAVDKDLSIARVRDACVKASRISKDFRKALEEKRLEIDKDASGRTRIAQR
jgi:hypothetical protein